MYNANPLDAVFKGKGTLVQNLISRFCRIVGNFASLYTTPSGRGHAPMDYAIVVSWKAVIKCLFPKSVEGDLLSLVHLSNSIRYTDKSNPLQAGDEIESEAHIVSIRWTPQGKIVEVMANIHKNGKVILEILSKFLYRGTASPSDLYFEKGKDKKKKVIISEEQLAVLQSKGWIKWNSCADENLKIGSELLFHVEYYHEPHLDQKSLKRVDCTGVVLLKTETKEYLRCGEVSYSSLARLKTNPVLHYLDKNNHPFDVPFLFEGEGHSLLQESERKLAITTRSTNQTYSDISGDRNPIHTNSFFADLAGLPGTITHGMWTSAAVRALVETYAGDNQPLRVTEYQVSFVGMVLPNEQLTIKLRHIGMKDGNKLVKVETFNQLGEKVLEGTAEVEQPRTAYLFTGQGSQEVGMGMDLYQTSRVAKEIWDQADRHLFLKFGFSIIDIVRNNPKQLTVYFGGPRGQEIQNNYRSLKYESADLPEAQPLFPTITDQCTSYTFTSPSGLLFATQFAQPALTLMEKAAYEDLRANGLASPQSSFAGHSLGEYSALASVGDVLSIETLCDIVFYRGLTMQVAVKRDSEGRSQYGMVATNPTRVSKTFTDQVLRQLITLIGEISGRLIEIVNYNVENWQYVVAGDLIALDCLGTVLNYVHTSKYDVQKMVGEYGVAGVKIRLKPVIEQALSKAYETQRESKYLTLERGVATFPLAGIDVPFHSAFLRSGVSSFRKCLELGIHSAAIDVSILRGNYIPNLTGVPFDISKEYLEVVWRACGSVVIKEIIDSWSDDKYTSAAQVQDLARIMLIELLAYQFASPVRWIETQDELFTTLAIERLIEIGPSPVLSGMAERTLKIKYQEYDDALNNNRTVWCYSKNRNEIYYQDEPVAASEVDTKPASPVVASPTVVQADVAQPRTATKTLEYVLNSKA